MQLAENIELTAILKFLFLCQHLITILTKITNPSLLYNFKKLFEGQWIDVVTWVNLKTRPIRNALKINLYVKLNPTCILIDFDG